jgi:hypothetical protein
MGKGSMLRTLRRMLVFRVIETERTQPPGTSADSLNFYWRERRALEWAIRELEPLAGGG